MSIGEESLKSIRAAHLLSLATSGVALVLALAPFTTDYSDAIKEARRILDPQSVVQYEDYARKSITARFANPDLLPRRTDDPSAVEIELLYFVEHGLNVCCVSPDPPVNVNGNVAFKHALAYLSPPIPKPIRDWSSWTESHAPIKYWKPDWATASVYRDSGRTNACGSRCTSDKIRMLRFFDVRPVPDAHAGDTWTVPSVGYRVLAFFEQGLRQPSPSTSDQWWRPIVDLPSEGLTNSSLHKRLSEKGRSLVIAYVTAFSEPVTLSAVTESGSGSVLDWLRYDSASRAIFEMPSIREHWSKLEGKTVQEALTYMEAEQKSLRDINLLGLAVPGSISVVAIPFAFVLSHLYLFMHLRSVVRSLKDSPLELFPWIGIYEDRVPQVVTTMSLTAAPTLLTLWLTIRCYSRLDPYHAILACAFGIWALILGWLSAQEAATLRSRWWSSHPSTEKSGD